MTRREKEVVIIRMFNPPKPREKSRRIKVLKAFARRHGLDAAGALLDDINQVAYGAARSNWLFCDNPAFGEN